MRILILGANGRTGQLATSKALEHGHTVTALVRRPSSMQAQQGLVVIEGTPLSQADIEKAFSATPDDPVQAVLVTLNNPRASDNPFSKPIAPPYFIRDSVRNVTTVMRNHGVKEIIIMSSVGIGNSFSQIPWITKLLFRYTNMRSVMGDHDALDAVIHESHDLDWTLVRPTMLKDGGAAPIRELGEIGEGVGLFDATTRASVAEFMVRAVEADTWTKKAVVITN